MNCQGQFFGMTRRKFTEAEIGRIAERVAFGLRGHVKMLEKMAANGETK